MKTSLTESSVKTFLMVLARIGAIVSVRILDRGSSCFKGKGVGDDDLLDGESSICW